MGKNTYIETSKQFEKKSEYQEKKSVNQIELREDRSRKDNNIWNENSERKYDQKVPEIHSPYQKKKIIIIILSIRA